MPKRQALDDGRDGSNKRPRFPKATDLAVIFEEMDNGMVVRDNSKYLAKLDKSTLFTRPTQLGKSTLLALAELVYSKTETAPETIAVSVPAHERNSCYVIRFDFLNVFSSENDKTWQENLKAIDSSLLGYVKECISDFLSSNVELKPFFLTEAPNPVAGDYLRRLSKAVEFYSNKNKAREILMVLVDEYDQPLRETLFLLLYQFDKSDVVRYCPNYVSFFQACKLVGQMKPSYNKVWVTGVTPIALDLISGFKPTNMTFDAVLLDAVGLRAEDVDSMLERVNEVEPFVDDQRERLREAIKDNANHLQFLTGSPLYHTRMVNELMAQIMDPKRRELWLADLKFLPATREQAPSAIYKLLKKCKHCRSVAKDLVSQRDIVGKLNKELNLVDIAKQDIKKDDYLTLLVHLGVASVHLNTGREGHIFRATSRHFRSRYLKEMLGVTLAPIFECASAEEIYAQKDLLQDFIETLPTSGMERMINWAKKRGNHILELQFQGFLVGALHDHFLADDDAADDDDAPIDTTQEDKLVSKRRTYVRIANDSTLIVLELKQKPSVRAGPTDTEMSDYHEQLSDYVEEINGEGKYDIVAGFVVVMYANGTEFRVEPTTYGSS